MSTYALAYSPGSVSLCRDHAGDDERAASLRSRAGIPPLGPVAASTGGGCAVCSWLADQALGVPTPWAWEPAPHPLTPGPLRSAPLILPGDVEPAGYVGGWVEAGSVWSVKRCDGAPLVYRSRAAALGAASRAMAEQDAAEEAALDV